MKRTSIIASLVIALLLATASVALAGTTKTRTPIYDNASGTEGNEVGWTQLHRDDDGLKATVKTSGLMPGGVYTFWWVTVPTGDPMEGVFVDLLGSTIVGQNGKATVHGSVAVGTPSISIPFDSFLTFVPMANPEEAVVRVEVAYHGQADSDNFSDDWVLDFWTGEESLCSAFPGPGFNHCPIAQASQDVPAS
jgi:hypothetical protein